MVRVTDFDYELSEEAIAQTPVEPRDAARLLDATGRSVVHRHVRDLDQLLGPGDVVVVNDTRVMAARLELRKETGGAAEVLLLEPTGHPGQWQALVRPGRRLPEGTVLYHEDQALVEIGASLEDGRRLVTITDEAMAVAGRVPLPPYIQETLEDPGRYQTVFARRPGSAAAPTAGLHLTEALLDRIRDRGATIEQVELQVGLGTFRPITSELIDDHVMHHEHYCVRPPVWDRIRAAQRVVAVGTTVVRTLESVAATERLSGSTDLFIRRGHQWKVVDLLLTNFHVPKSSLLVLVDALVGDRWRDLYQLALNEGYRFLSFGDCMLLDAHADPDAAVCNGQPTIGHP